MPEAGPREALLQGTGQNLGLDINRMAHAKTFCG